MDFRLIDTEKCCPKPLADSSGCCRIPCDRITKATLHAIVYGRHQLSTRKSTSGQLTVNIGASNRDAAAILAANPALAVKTLFSLWARLLAEAFNDPGAMLAVTLNQFCEDLGYAKHPHGGFKAETKRATLGMFHALTSLEIAGSYSPPGSTTAPVKFEGPAWLAKSSQSNTLGGTRLIFSPGNWYQTPGWRKFNDDFALVPERFLSLRPDREQWAILIGGYLVLLGKMDGYGIRSGGATDLRMETLLSKTGLIADRRNPGRMLNKLETGLKRLKEVGVIHEWDYDPARPPRCADERTINRLKILLRWPTHLAEVGKHLQARRDAAVKSARRKAADRIPAACR